MNIWRNEGNVSSDRNRGFLGCYAV